MAQEPERLREVLEAPADDGPRLAYAEFLPDRADEPSRARARFIRAQLDLALAEPGSEATFELQGEVLDLLDAHRGPWTATLPPEAREPMFDRGVVELVQCSSADFAAHGADLVANAPIRHLDLQNFGDLTGLSGSPHLQRSRSLSLGRTGLTDAQLNEIAAAPTLRQLRWLSIAQCAIGEDGAEALATSKTLPALRYVRFFGNPFDPSERQGHDQGGGGRHMVAARGPRPRSQARRAALAPHWRDHARGRGAESFSHWLTPKGASGGSRS